MLKECITSIRMLLVMTVITGAIYPIFITGASWLFFNEKAHGSLIYKDGRVAGSSLIGQKFMEEKYFHGRPSACDYNTMPSGASNAGFTNKDFIKNLNSRLADLKRKYPDADRIPDDMLFASGSGIDPHISPAAAKLQLDRVAKVRSFNEEQRKKLSTLVDAFTEERQMGLLGERRVNVLLLNAALDSMMTAAR